MAVRSPKIGNSQSIDHLGIVFCFLTSNELNKGSSSHSSYLTIKDRERKSHRSVNLSLNLENIEHNWITGEDLVKSMANSKRSRLERRENKVD